MRPLYVVSIALALLLAATAWYFWPHAKAILTVTNYPSKGTDIVAFGDSLVAGYGSTGGGGFVSILAKSIGVPIVNLGKDGDTTSSALARINSFDKYNPKVVILLVGGNDYLEQQSMTQAFANLGQIIEDIQSRGAVVLLVGVRISPLVGNFDPQFEGLATKYKTAYVPHVMDGILGNKQFMYDSIHPNDAGYALIAERILPTLKTVVQ